MPSRVPAESPRTLQSSLVNSKMNCGALSERIVLGSPCKHHTWSLNKVAKSKVEVIFRQGKRMTSLEKQSMTTPIESKPLKGGSLLTKSKEISSHGWKGTGSGVVGLAMILLYLDDYLLSYRIASHLTTPTDRLRV
jgi:hypothetical protein